MGKFYRRSIQFFSMILFNLNIKGFFSGEIYKGNLKKYCVPGLNCYSCPGALGSCPIGSLQAVLGHFKYKFSFYLTGFFILFGTLLGRGICGYLCPFGFFQEILFKIKTKKLKLKRSFVYTKYFVLAIFVIGLPLIYTNSIGLGDPYFCKWICPVGTLQAGIPLVIKNDFLQNIIGVLFYWKIFLLIIVIISSIFLYRSFCKILCPLGAIYGLFNKISVYRYYYDEEKCIKCNKCVKICPMDINPYRQINDIECIRCGKCIETCPTESLSPIFSLAEGSKKNEKKIF